MIHDVLYHFDIFAYLYYVGLHLTVILVVTIQCTMTVESLVYSVLLIYVLPQNIYVKGIFCSTFSTLQFYNNL